MLTITVDNFISKIGCLLIVAIFTGCATSSAPQKSAGTANPPGKTSSAREPSLAPKKSATATLLLLTTCDAITNQLRGFHQQTFPTNWVCEGRGILRSLRGERIDLITREKFKDFELTLDWKVTRAASSGILYAVSETTSDLQSSGPEMQVNDDLNHPDGKTPKFSAGALYDLIAPNNSKKLFRAGEFNHVRILSRKGHVEHWINGMKILEYEWGSPEMKTLIADSKFAKEPNFMKDRNGHIALQHHGAEVYFRNIQIRRL